MTEISSTAGHIVGMCLHQGKIYIACQFAVYEFTDAAHPEPARWREILTVSQPEGVLHARR